jgi:TonB-dependent receptor
MKINTSFPLVVLIGIILYFCSFQVVSQAQTSHIVDKERNTRIHTTHAVLTPFHVFDKLISIDFENVKLEYALREIADKSGILLSYSPDILPADKLVTVQKEYITVTEAFDLLLAEHNVGLLVQMPNRAVLTSDEQIDRETGSITGIVRDRSTGGVLVGANVVLQGTTLGSAANNDGVYHIRRVPAGDHILVASYLGYQRKDDIRITVRGGQELELDIYLEWIGVTLDEVTISAQARGQVDAINRQLASRGISNIVAADRIRELPDVNAAESIGRLPGVSIQRTGGEANKITIRGLSPKYNVISVNGVRIPATGGDDRSVDLSLISSNMLEGIELMKAITPDQDADVLGGSVDLRLREAPSRPQVNFSMQGGYNRIQDYYGNYNLTGTISNRFFTDRLGAIINFNFDEYDRSADKFSSDYRPRRNLQTDDTEIVIQSLNLREENVTRGRSGASAFLDYRIPGGKITANSFYNRLTWSGVHNVNRYQIADASHHYDLELRGGNTSIFTGTIGIEQNFGSVRYDFSAARTASRTDRPDERVWIFRETGAALDADFPGLTPETRPTEILPYRDPDPNLTWLMGIRSTDINLEENQTIAQFNVEVPFRLSSQINGFIKTGGKFRWLDRSNDEEVHGREGLADGNVGGPNTQLELVDEQFPDWDIEELTSTWGGLPITGFLRNYTRSNFLNGQYPLGFVIDLNMMNQLADFFSSFPPRPEGMWQKYGVGSFGRDYKGVEEYQAAYIMSEFNFGRYLKLISGIRWEKDFSEYEGQTYRDMSRYPVEGEPAGYVETKNTRGNEFLLPMVHVIGQPTDWLQVRFARTETLTRPDYIHFAPITRVNYYHTYINAANALLKPSHSTNYDAVLSVYQKHIGLFSVSGFTKNIKDLIFPMEYFLVRDALTVGGEGIHPLPGMNIPEEWYASSMPSVFSYINNPSPARYEGFEIDWQTNFWYLPSPLQGLVLNINYTRIWSEMEKQLYLLERVLVRPPNVYRWDLIEYSRKTRMPDQPSRILNTTIGYDYRGFSLRVSYLHQTDVVTFIHRESVLDHFSDNYARWDLALQQRIGRGFQVFANFNNLNNRPDKSFRGDAFFHPTYTEYYGFTMDVGFRYSF